MAYGFNEDRSKVDIYSVDDIDRELENIQERIDNKLIIDPDNYSGTDSQKLAAAINEAGVSSNSTIILTRMYTLSSNLNIIHDAEANARLTFIGIGKNCGIDAKSYSITYASGYSGSRGMCSFTNLLFKGSGSLFLVQYLIRINFNNCTFENFKHVFNVSRYMQSYYFDQCTFRNISDYVIQAVGTMPVGLWDCQFTQCLVEKCRGFLTATSAQGVYISQCCIESSFGIAIKIVGEARNLVVSNCYFEHNNNGTYLPEGETAGNGETIDFSGLTNWYTGITVSDNKFYYSSGNEIIVACDHDIDQGSVAIRNNFTNSNIVLVKAPSSRNNPYQGIIVEGTNDWQLQPYLHIFNNLSKHNLTPRGFVNNTDLNETLLDTGIYIKTSSTTLVNAPDIGNYFVLINIVLTPTSVYQLAWGNNKLAFRYTLSANWKVLQ